MATSGVFRVSRDMLLWRHREKKAPAAGLVASPPGRG